MQVVIIPPRSYPPPRAIQPSQRYVMYTSLHAIPTTAPTRMYLFIQALEPPSKSNRYGRMRAARQ